MASRLPLTDRPHPRNRRPNRKLLSRWARRPLATLAQERAFPRVVLVCWSAAQLLAPGGAVALRPIHTADHGRTQLTHCTNWTRIRPQHSSGVSLFAISATSPQDIWTGGQTDAGEAIMLHWNGHRWTRFGPRALAVTAHSSDTTIVDIDAVAPNDVWAVGGGHFGFVYHWNGRRWRGTVIRRGVSFIESVSATGPTDVWVAGGFRKSFGFGSIIEHWNGLRWQSVKSPKAASPSSVDAFGPANVWISGSAGNYGAIDHWNGERWSVANIPSGARHSGEVETIAGSQSALVGLAFDGSLLRRGRTRWTRWAPPLPKQFSPMGMVPVAGGALVSGYINLTNALQVAVFDWNGSRWARLKIPHPNSPTSQLPGVAALGTDAWAVGSYEGASETDFPVIIRSTKC